MKPFVDYACMPAVLSAPQATGDRARADAWFAKYDRMPTELKTALAGTSAIPVDINPVFSFKDDAR